MRINVFFIIFIGCFFSTYIYAQIKNETSIEFIADSGAKTMAFEGHLLVKENRANPQSRDIRINYVRFPATTSIGKKNPPIVYLAGGPGGSGIRTAKWRRFPLFMALREHADVIALDQRGTGQSEQTERCVSNSRLPLNQPISRDQLQNRYFQAVANCFNQWKQQGVDIYGYTTTQNALDIDDLRHHLGVKKVSLWGISYGSHLALAAIKAMPDYIDKVILASVEGLDQTVKLPTNTDLYFQRVQDVIDQQSLKAEVPDLTALIKSVHTSLDNAPLKLKIPKSNGNTTSMLFQKTHMQMLASMMIADPNKYLAMLIQTYLSLQKGDTSLLVNILQRDIFSDNPISFRLMPLAMDIASGISDKRLSIVENQTKSALLGDILNFPMPILNKVDKKLDLGEDFRVDPVNTKIPTLVFTGSLDGRTYPSAQAKAISGLSNLTHITVEHAGHNLYTSSPEVLLIMKDFLDEKKITSSNIVLQLPNLDFDFDVE